MRAFNLPNTLTVARIIIIPVFITAVLYRRHHYALALFILAALTDLLDGYIARVTNQKTTLGQFLDPLADKFLLVSSFILFSVQDWIPLWLTITVISRDLIVVIGWFLLYMLTQQVTVETVFMGKVAIALQLITLSSVLLDINLPNLLPPLQVLFAVTAATTAASGIQYLYRGLRQADAI